MPGRKTDSNTDVVAGRREPLSQVGNGNSALLRRGTNEMSRRAVELRMKLDELDVESVRRWRARDNWRIESENDDWSMRSGPARSGVLRLGTLDRATGLEFRVRW